MPTSGHRSCTQVLHSVSRVDRKDIRVMGVSEIAVRIKLGRDRAAQIVQRRDFPEPIGKLVMGNVWLAQDVDDWVREHRPHLDEPDEA